MVERAAPSGSRRLLTGWGRTAPTAATVVAPADEKEIEGRIARAPERGLIARGLGRSYNDAAQNAGGTVLDLTGRRTVRAFDAGTGEVTVDAGVSIDDLFRLFVPRGWFPPVTPGTRAVTVGGAIAADIHGKNHHRDGSFGRHVRAMRLHTPGRGVLHLRPDADPEEFWATVGGMGLTGVISEATVALTPVETSRVAVDTDRLPDLDAALAAMEEGDHRYPYSVAWIDCLARGRHLGRSVLTQAHHATVDQLAPADRPTALDFAPRPPLPAVPWAPSGLLNRWTVRAFNELWFRKAPLRERGRIQHAAGFFHPLDGVAGWNRLYGRRGFVQYQFVVPFGAEDTLRSILEQLSGARVASFLAVLKRFGPGTPGPLSFPAPGWTLALDIPATGVPLAELLDRIDEQVAAVGGRCYMAKDARLRPELVPVMYPRLGEWRSVRDRLDPDRQMVSDLARRLGLAGARGAS